MGKSGILLTLVLVTSLVAMGAGGVSAQSEMVTLTVSVTNTAGDSVGSADITASWDGGSTRATTASNGKAFVDVPDGADVEIAIEHPDYVRNSVSRVSDASERNVDITVYDKATATITVEDQNGLVDDARVVISKDGEAVVDRLTTDGTVETGTIEAGEYEVWVAKSGYFASSVDLDVTGDTAQTVSIERGTVTLAVNITDDYFDPPRPIAGATATIDDVGSIITQADGVQRISVPVNSQLDVSVTKDGFVTVERTISIQESDVTLEVDIARSPTLHAEVMSDRVVVGEDILVKVTDEYGDPVNGAKVLVDGAEAGETAGDGTASVTIEEGGDQEVVVQMNGLSSSKTVVTGVVPAGEETTTTETTDDTSTDETTSTVPAVPGFGVELVIIGVALVAVLFGIRSWQRD